MTNKEIEIEDNEDCLAMGHDEEINFDDGTYVQWTCKRCGCEGDYSR